MNVAIEKWWCRGERTRDALEPDNISLPYTVVALMSYFLYLFFPWEVKEKGAGCLLTRRFKSQDCCHGCYYTMEQGKVDGIAALQRGVYICQMDLDWLTASSFCLHVDWIYP